MIEKYERNGYYFVRINSEVFRLFTLNGCPRCLDPNYLQLCPSFRARNVNFTLHSFGIYYGYQAWLNYFGTYDWDPFSSQILNNKPQKSLDKNIKIERGKKFAEILKWLLIEEKQININHYSMIISIPSYKNYNQVDCFGVPLSIMLNLDYKKDILKRNQNKAYEFIGSNLNGQNIILLDDVYTGTNQTIEKNAKLLLNNNSGEILAVVLARTLDVSQHFFEIE